LLREQITRFAEKPPQTTPVLDETVLASVQATVEAMIQGEVVPALQAMGIQYTTAIERRMKSLEQSIQPVEDQTNDIRRRAELIEVDA
jgi:hypothetical protein